ncbi:MAG: hypothetical protein AAGA55_04985, partial [Planctomycetota bacterium]
MISKATAIACVLFASAAGAEDVLYSGALTETQAQFSADTFIDAPGEDFEGFGDGEAVGVFGAFGGAVRFDPTFADGSPAPLPVVRTFAGAPSGNKWIVNTGTGRPAGSEWVFRPELANVNIYVFGLATIGDDLIRVQGFDAEANLVVSVDSQPIPDGAFTGFVSEVGVRRIVITPIGDGDLEAGIDDLSVSLVPGGLCVA